MKKILAINGGRPILKKPLPVSNTIGDEEKRAAIRVLDSGHLSDFIGAHNEYFLGGREVKRFETEFCKRFKVNHAISFNSATTALHAAISALQIGPGDEVIVSPYTMSASVSCVLMNGAIPIFADIDKETFCLDAAEIERKITKRTKAIVVVNLFGLPADLETIIKLAKKHNIKVIEDNAQSPGALYKGKFAGTWGDIGVFSFNVHKIIQSGEGGMLVTNNGRHAFRAQLVRNHGEVVVDQIPDLKTDDKIILGSNYRMTELIAAIAYEQLKKLNLLNRKRIILTKYLTSQLKKIPGIVTPTIHKNRKHVFYVYPIKIKEKIFGISRDKFVNAMNAEGFPMSFGYCKPIYLLPVFQQRRIFNQTQFPFVYQDCDTKYHKGLCPIAEKMYEEELTFTTICQYPNTTKEIDLFMDAIKKIRNHKTELI